MSRATYEDQQVTKPASGANRTPHDRTARAGDSSVGEAPRRAAAQPSADVPPLASRASSPTPDAANQNVIRSANRRAEPTPAPAEDGRILLLKRGHLISFAGLFLFTIFLYLRPYELIPALSFLSTATLWIAVATLAIFFPLQLAVEGNLTARPREINLVLLFTLLALLSIPLASDRSTAWEHFNESLLKAVLVFILIVNTTRTMGRLNLLLWFVIGVSCLASYYGLRDFAAGNASIEGYRVQGSLGNMLANPNDFAMHLSTITPITLGLCLGTRNKILKLVLLACAVLMVAGNTVTYSRGGFLGLAAGSIAFAWLATKGKSNRGMILGALIVGGLLFAVLAPGGYGSRLLSIANSNLDPVGSSTARSNLLKRSILVAARHPVFGVGIGNFPMFSIRNQVAHNAYTNTAAEIGVAGMVVYVLFIVSPLRRLGTLAGVTAASIARGASDRKSALRSKRERYYHFLSIGMFAGIIAYMVSSFFGSVQYHFYIYYLVGYAVVLRRLYESEFSELPVGTEREKVKGELRRGMLGGEGRRGGVPSPAAPAPSRNIEAGRSAA